MRREKSFVHSEAKDPPSSSPSCLKEEEEWHNFTHFTTLPPTVPFRPCEKQLLFFFFPFATRGVWLRGAFFLSLLASLWERGAVKRTASSFLRPTLSVSELMRWSVGFWGKDFLFLSLVTLPGILGMSPSGALRIFFKVKEQLFYACLAMYSIGKKILE